MKTEYVQAYQSADWLRRVLRANGVFSGLSGLAALVAARPLAAFTGIDNTAVFLVLGIGLMLYAAFLFVATAQPVIDRRLGWTAVVLDALWVVGSAAILLAGWPPLTVAGQWTVALLAEVVFIFAVLQTYALRRPTR